MIKRECGCKEDCIETKLSVLRKIEENNYKDNKDPIHIGVIFHVCFEGYNPTEIVKDIDYSIECINKDFNMQCSNFNFGENKYNLPDLKQTYDSYISVATACNIYFDKITVIYKPIPKQNSMNISVLDNNIKGRSPPINPDKYLNIWIADISDNLLGYAQFPWEESPNTDGVVLSKNIFGRKPTYSNYNLNKTMTHEVGHWLGLYHTFQETFNYQDGLSSQQKKGDCVVDTPPQKTPTYGNPFSNTNLWPESRPIDESKSYRHMFMNFMDYSDDISMFMFTRDQVTKMRQAILLYRNNIISKPEIIQINESFIAFCNFDNTIYGWESPIKLIDNTNSASIGPGYGISGSKSLYTRRNSQGEFIVNLEKYNEATISFLAKVTNPWTYIFVKSTKINRWFSAILKTNTTYTNYSFQLPYPSNNYVIRLGTIGNNSIYSYFENISIKSI